MTRSTMWSSSRTTIGAAATSGFRVVRHLDQVLVGVAEIHGSDRAGRARLRNGPFDDLDIASPQMRDDVVERRRRDEAKIDRSGRRSCCLRLEFASGFVQIEFLAPERERLAIAGERQRSHAKNPRIKRTRGLDVLHRQDDVVDAVDIHGVQNSRMLTRSMTRTSMASPAIVIRASVTGSRKRRGPALPGLR